MTSKEKAFVRCVTIELALGISPVDTWCQRDSVIYEGVNEIPPQCLLNVNKHVPREFTRSSQTDSRFCVAEEPFQQ
jgi:hypothetical protein